MVFCPNKWILHQVQDDYYPREIGFEPILSASEADVLTIDTTLLYLSLRIKSGINFRVTMVPHTIYKVSNRKKYKQNSES